LDPTKFQRILQAVLIIVGLNLLAHFLPFERVSLAGDDIEYLTVPSQERWEYARSQMALSSRRPLEIFHILLHWIAGDHKLLWVAAEFLASSLLAGCVYLLMRQLIGDPVGGLACTVFYVLLPNKERLYHHLGYTHIHAVIALTVVSLIFFLAYLRTSRTVHLWASVACYTITVFWYELGFFLPLVLLIAAVPYGKKKMGACLLFLLPVALNTLWRSGVFGGGDFTLAPLFRATFWDNLLDARKLYFGQPMLKWILYGLVRFPSIQRSWLLFLLAADGLVLWGSFRWLRKSSLAAIPLKLLPVALAMTLFFLIPAAMGYEVLGRHTPLSSIGFSILAIAALRWLVGPRPLLPVLLTALLGVSLMICQGLAWSQVVSCRMNQAILETLQQKKASLATADRVVIDQDSFAQRIPSAFRMLDPENHLDTYWGVDGLLGENFRGPVHWVTGRRIPVEIIRSERRLIPRKGTVLIDYAAVYPEGFHDGRRGRLPR